MKTFNDLERAAYMAGDTTLSDAYQACATLARLDDDLPMDFDIDAPMDVQIEKHVETETLRNCPDYEAYKQFFFDCFERLGARYPCASVTSDYDQSVIFDAIEKGESK